jgi:putative transposase
MKEIDCLIVLGVLKWQPLSKWASPSFIIPKKDHTVRTIADFRELNKRIVRKPYPIPRISTTLQELEGFTYATTLDLNMGYYTIRLDPAAAEMCIIIFPWGKYSYQRLPMGFAGLADIFQAEMGNQMAALECIRAYIDNLLVITKSSHDDHLGKLEQVFIRLRNACLKINATKSFFCTQETEYLGYILTRGDIKPQPHEAHAILVLNLPKSVKELQRFLGMVQYYRDMWAKHSEMLAPLTDLVGECGETKATNKNGTKKKP